MQDIQPTSRPYGPGIEQLAESHHFFHGAVLYIIKADYKWNGASIPRALWSVVGTPFSQKFRRACLEHDFLYDKRFISRKEADVHMRKTLRKNGTGRTIAWMMYRGVRAGGWLAWRKNKEL